MPMRIPDPVRELLERPNYVHLATLRADGSPRNWVVWVGLEGDHILVWYVGRGMEGQGHGTRPPRRALYHRADFCAPLPAALAIARRSAFVRELEPVREPSLAGVERGRRSPKPRRNCAVATSRPATAGGQRTRCHRGLLWLLALTCSGRGPRTRGLYRSGALPRGSSPRIFLG